MPVNVAESLAENPRLSTDGRAAFLRDALAAVTPLATRFAAAREAQELLERDLLPRCAEGAPYLVGGIVGPNNAGKSALFNALVGRDLSPSEPTGGATRRLVGAASATLLERLHAHPNLIGFRMRRAGDDEIRADALSTPDDPTELLVYEEATLPSHVLLIDTPDFDSVLAGNRRVSETLLAVADVVIAVVTRHSYQNRAVVEFFQEWLQHGRPWLLVYNEALDESVARKHCEKLIEDVATAPLASYWAAHRLEIQRGEEPLRVQRLRLDARHESPSGLAHVAANDRELRALLLDPAAAAEIKTVAFHASLARLRSALEATAASVAAAAQATAAVRARAEQIAHDAGVEIAAQAMPGAPFIDAFRVVLDRRSNFVSRGWRTLVRGIRVGIESLPTLLRGRAASDVGASLGRAEVDALRRAWPRFWEELARDLGREGRDPVRRDSPAEIVAALDADLGSSDSAAFERSVAAFSAQTADLGTFQQACERLIDEAIEARGFDIDIQAAADLATLAPVALATAVIITTSGVGADIAAAGGGAVSTFLMEKYSHVLGSGITKAARQRWTQTRGAQLGEILLAVALPRALAEIETVRRADEGMAERLRELTEKLV